MVKKTYTKDELGEVKYTRGKNINILVLYLIVLFHVN